MWCGGQGAPAPRKADGATNPSPDAGWPHGLEKEEQGVRAVGGWRLGTQRHPSMSVGARLPARMFTCSCGVGGRKGWPEWPWSSLFFPQPSVLCQRPRSELCAPVGCSVLLRRSCEISYFLLSTHSCERLGGRLVPWIFAAWPAFFPSEVSKAKTQKTIQALFPCVSQSACKEGAFQPMAGTMLLSPKQSPSYLSGLSSRCSSTSYREITLKSKFIYITTLLNCLK